MGTWPVWRVAFVLAGIGGCHGVIGDPGGGDQGGGAGASPGVTPPAGGSAPGSAGGPGGMAGASGTGGAAACSRPVLPVSTGSIRLTDRQFRNTIAALFPFPVEVGAYPATSFQDEFTTSTSANEVLYADIQTFAETAEHIALQAVGHRAQLLPCNPAGNEASCARQFIAAFTERAYRRPADPADQQPLVQLYDGLRAGAADFDTAIAAVIAAVLQSPQVLYRLELGAPVAGGRRLTAYEAASRLSYLYWDAPPDPALLEQARTGALADGRAMEAEATRLLADPRARDPVWRFLSEWLGFGDAVYDTRVDPALAAAFAEEARRFSLGLAFDDPAATAAELLTSDRTVLNQRLARHYGVASASTGDGDWQPATLPAAQRAGVLAKAQVATAHSPVGDTSVVKRGKFALERLLCFELGAPPPGAQSMNPVLPAGASVRERIDARLALPACNGCHQYLDHAGIGMEDLDAVGRPRERYPSGQPVDPAGELLPLDGPDRSFVGTAGLAARVAASPAFTDCLTSQWYRYAVGHRESDDEAACHVQRLRERFAAGGHKLRDLLLSISGSDAFVLRP